MTNLRIRKPANIQSSYKPINTPTTFNPLKNIEAKSYVNVNNYVNSKEKAQRYVREYCSPRTLSRVKTVYPLNTPVGSYYQKACDKARIASFSYNTNSGSIPASPSWANSILEELPKIGGKRKTRRSVRKTRKAKRSHRKGTRRH